MDSTIYKVVVDAGAGVPIEPFALECLELAKIIRPTVYMLFNGAGVEVEPEHDNKHSIVARWHIEFDRLNRMRRETP